MAKVTGTCQITLPKTVVDQCGIRVGDELDTRFRWQWELSI